MAESEDSMRIKTESYEDSVLSLVNGSIELDSDINEIRKSIATPKTAFNRDEYLQAYKNITHESKRSQLMNNILHRRLAEYYRKRNLEHVLKPFQGTVDLEESYQQKLLAYEELKHTVEIGAANIWKKITEAENNYVQRLEQAEEQFLKLQNWERSIGTGLIYSKKGKQMSEKTLSKFITLQARKSEQASALSLKYIRARNAIAELEAIVKKLDILRPGLYVYQYEQLKVDNQDYKIKIEDREDDLISTRSKYSKHNQGLAHIREKMDHTEQLIEVAECEFGESEITYMDVREKLNTEKASRDKLRWLLQAEVKKAGLLTKKDLLRDFQTAVNEIAVLRKKKETLEAQILYTKEELRRGNKNINHKI